MKDERTYLVYIRDSIQAINEYTVDGRETFMATTIVQDAVLHRLEALTDATGHLSEERKAQYPAVDWRAIRGFRNRLAHDYMGINLEIVWSVVTKYLPSLKAAVDAMLTALESDSPQ